MPDQPTTEQIPHHVMMSELESQLHSAISQLVMANARIRTRDDTIRQLQQERDELRHSLAAALENKYASSE